MTIALVQAQWRKLAYDPLADLRFEVEVVSDGGSVWVMDDGMNIADLNWRLDGGEGVISGVYVDSTWRLNGVAARMLQVARKAVNYPIVHSTDLSDDGRAWSHAVGKLASADDAFDDRLGRCYELSGRYVAFHPGCSLVHGSIQGNDKPRIDHAWVIKPDGLVYDPVLDEDFDPWLHRALFNAKEDVRYDQEQVQVEMLKAKHWGPW